MNTFTTADLKNAIRQGPYAWPGGYPCYFITHDGDYLSWKAVRDNFRLVLRDMRDNYRHGWGVTWFGINYEDQDLYCDHTGERIPAAYEPDEGPTP